MDGVWIKTEALEKLRADLAAMTKERDEAITAAQSLSEGQPFDKVLAASIVKRSMDQLAAVQAREANLRKALDNIHLNAINSKHSKAYSALAQQALALPADDSALREALAQERERICELPQIKYNLIAVDAIRSMK